MITYNHDKFIAQAIESVLMQETDFTVELVIGEDCSEDNTRKILLKYADNFPNKIKLLLHDKNVGMINNQIAVIKQCAGKYIAFLEGDDYWTDTYKLQKQVNFLEQNVSYSACCHNVFTLDLDETFSPQWPWQTDRDILLNELLQGNCISTLSMVTRNYGEKLFPVKYAESPFGDYIIHLFNAQRGSIRYLAEIMGVYRVHEGGVWTARRFTIDKEYALNKKLLETYKSLYVDFSKNKDARKQFKNKQAEILNQLRIIACKLGLPKESKLYARKYVCLLLKQGALFSRQLFSGKLNWLAYQFFKKRCLK